METRKIGIILNGVTGRMGTNQHLVRSILAIMKQGGVKVSNDLRLIMHRMKRCVSCSPKNAHANFAAAIC